MTAPTAVVPLKLGAGAKGRLGHALRAPERDRLTRALAAHVIDVLRAAGLRVSVAVTGGPFDHDGADDVVDAPEGLNAAVRCGLVRSGLPALVVPADLPWLSPDDVLAVLGRDRDVVVAPTRDGGTGALLLRRPMTTCFGPASGLAHAARARSLGWTTSVVSVPGFRRDLDAVSDLVAAAASPALRRGPDVWTPVLARARNASRPRG